MSTRTQAALLIDTHHPLPEPLIPDGTPKETDTTALQAAITAWERSGRPDSLGDLEAFLDQHPQSAWSLALQANLGILCASQAQFGKALDWLERTFVAGEAATAVNLRRLMDRVLGELLHLHARLGSVESLDRWLQEADRRALQGSAFQHRSEARMALWSLRNQTGVAHRCGAAAVKEVLLAQDGKPAQALLKTLESARSGPEGMTLADLERLAGEAGLTLQAFRRIDAQAEIPVPSVVHWQVGHFGTLLAFQNGQYLLRDSVYPQDRWIDADTVAEEGSGYFLLPIQAKSSGFVALETGQKTQISGRGYVSGNAPQQAGSPTTKSSKCTPGMATYDAYAAIAGLKIDDNPGGYVPPKGPAVRFDLTYNQRDTNQPANFTFSNVGPQWNHHWMGWIQDIPGQPGNSVMRYVPAGGVVFYSGYDSTTGAFAPETSDGAVLVLESENPVRYRLQKPDGSSETYAQSNGAVSGTRYVLLSAIRDASGNAVAFAYDDQNRLTTVTDALGQKTTLTYGDPQDTLLITAVSDPFGRTATLAYDDTGRLISITDVMGMMSAFTYDAGSVITALTTPYGKSQFSYGESGTQIWLNMIDASGHTERVEFNQNVPGIPFSDPIAPEGMNLFNAYLPDRNSFYWDAQAYAAGGEDYANAHLYHWLHWGPNTSLASGVLESQKDPLTRRVWYNYPGQVWGGATGTLNLPSIIGRVLEDGTTQLTQMGYGDYGHITSFIDPAGRETLFTYAANGIDLTEVAQKTQSGQDLLFQATYDHRHLPLTITNAAGQTTTFTYNAAGQPLTVTDALGQITAYQYDDAGYLTEIRNANDVTATRFTYDAAGRVATVTDAEGYTLSLLYDALNRLTEVHYPDGTHRTYTYDKLDLSSQTNRLGVTTKYTYDAVRRLVSVTNPLGQVTAYGYNKAGYLTSLTDPAGNVTTWERDIQNRITAKVYANGTKETYTYDPATGQLATVTDAMGQVKTYGYTIDEQISTVAYTDALVDTPNVSFTYGKDYPRIISRSDGIGNTLYAYNPVGEMGAGQVGQKTTPHGTIDFGYDALGRRISRRVGDTEETFAYDAIGRVIEQTNPLAMFTIEYLGQSDRPTAILPENGLLDTYFRYGAQQEDRRLRAITHNAAFPLQAMDFLYQSNAEDQLTSATDIGGSIIPKWKHYQYDAAGRLTLEDALLGGLTTFQYDPADNMTSMQAPEGSWTATYNDVNELVSRDDHTYSYDANGNMTGDGIRTYTWDAENRLVGIGYVDHPEKKTSFQYDGLNRRAVMVETHGSESTTSTFLWDGTDLLRVQTGSAMKWYYPQGEIHGTESLFYVSDRLGSVRETVNQDHLITARMSYTAYGETQTTLTPFIGKAPDYRYAGLFFHEQSGLYLAVFRAYDPSAGRWISRDPIGEDGGVNLYAYSKSVPINNNDSLGLSPNLSGFAKYELHKAIKFCAQPKNWISKELVSRVPGLQCFSELILAGQNKKRIRQECIAASTNPKSRFYGHPQSCEIIRPYSTFEGCIKFASTYGITDGGGK